MYECEWENINSVRMYPAGGGFGLTTGTADTGNMAVHKTFVMNSDMEDANEACIACHTGIAVKKMQN